MVVVLPEPFGPRNPYVLPSGTARSMPSTAATLPKCLARPRVSMPGQWGSWHHALGAGAF